jgi:putative polymerase
MLQRPLNQHSANWVSNYPAKLVATILVSSVCYLSVLSFLNARGIHVSAALVGLVEALIFMGCLSVQVKRLPLSTVTLGCCVCAWMIFTWLIRQGPDVKSLRDLIIPFLFLSLGQYVADVGFAERSLKLIVAILIAMGLFEVIFTDTYANLFNTFSFYVNVGGIQESSAMFEGQLLTLNGYRPEGIGRTILPFLLGSHRASSVLMEPVSLGNFAVILLAWVLSKPWLEIRKASGLVLILGAALLITLCDSRFGLMMSAALIALRFLPMPGKLVPALPFLILALVIGLASFMPSDGDNLLGRITRSGIELQHFDWSLVMGLSGPLPNFGDMGFAYVLSRFGAPLTIILSVGLFLIPMADQRGVRFRALIVLYLFASLAISGTSIFALKTAGLMWFLFGVLSTASHQDIETSANPRPSKTNFTRATSRAIDATRSFKGNQG